jgi:hypothetical protein
MTQLLVRHSLTAVNGDCPLCGLATSFAAGPQLVLADTGQPVCSSCGKRHDPPLASLVLLADEARRVGRIGRHTVVPPYTALLELAQAADNFASTVPTPREGG